MQNILNRTKDLIRFKTTQDQPDEIRKCADYILNCLNLPGIVTKTYVRNDKVSIVSTYNSANPKVFFNAHFDVVPGSIHQFEPRTDKDALYGRGSDDCKAQVSCLIQLMLDFIKSKPDIGIILTSDEEVHGQDGVELVLDRGHKSEFAIVCDGGDDYDIVTKHKGVLQVRLSATGKSAHSSRYWENGENAIEKLITSYAKVKSLFPKLKGPDWKTTANLSKINGGHTMNKVPDYAELYLDIRFTEEYNSDNIIKDLKSIEGIRVEIIANAQMLLTDPNNMYIKQLSKAASKILNRKIRTHVEHGATDARFFSEKGIPAVLFKSIGFGPHSDTEHIIISELPRYYNVLKEFVNSI